MKIIKIQFENINSLRGKHEVDFSVSPLKESRLFAITGPTGSGKSTLLDVIALALFNRVPRLGKISKKVIEEGGAILTRNADNAYASVEYECANGIYRSTWSISTNRNNKLRDYEMELADVSTGKNFDLKKSAVPSKNEELIGLTYDQFIKSILLAQGEFAKFLQVSKSERGELLEKITGTGIYRVLGRKAFEKKGLYAKALENLRTEMLIYNDQLLNSETLAESNTQNDEFETKVKSSEDKLKLLEDQIKLRDEISKIESSIKEKEIEIEQKKSGLKSFTTEHGEKLKLHESTSPFAEMLEDWKQNKQKLKSSEETKDELKKDLTKSKSDQSDTLIKASVLLKREIDSSEFLKSLTDFQVSVENLENQIGAKKQEYDSKFTLLISKGESLNYVPKSENIQGELDQLQSLKDSIEFEIEEIKKTLKGISTEEPDNAISSLEIDLTALQNGKEWTAQLKKHEESLKKEKDLLGANLKLEKTLPREIEKIASDNEKAQISLKSLRLESENQMLRASLEDHRAKLEDSKPCPLCGSLEHPWADHTPIPDDSLTEKIQEAESVFKDFNSNLSRKKEKLNGIQKEKLALQKRIDSLNKDKDNLTQDIKSNCSKWLSEDSVNWVGLIAKTKEQKEVLKKFVELSNKLKDVHSCIPIVEDLLDILKNKGKLSTSKNELFSGSNIRKTCETIRDSWKSVSQDIDSIKKQEKKNSEEIASYTEILTNLISELEPRLKELAFEGIEDAISKRLKESYYQQLKGRLNELSQQVKTSEASLILLQGQLVDKKEKLTEDQEEELKEKYDALKVSLTESRQLWEEVKRKIKNHQDNIKKIEALQERITEEEKVGKKWELLNQLIGDSTGKKFNDFAQDLTLQRLLILANIRLSQLIDRYQIASPSSEEDESLVAIDNHMGGQRRSVKTLSGGETFILSLSLALALSDLAAKNVEINSLFIDEGFGTLDPETLDQTIDTLEKLQTESSKTIGIISHVETLKERIETQIQLERNGQGYSSLKVI